MQMYSGLENNRKQMEPPSNCCFPLEKSRVADGKLGWLDTFAHAILHPKKTNNNPLLLTVHTSQERRLVYDHWIPLGH